MDISSPVLLATVCRNLLPGEKLLWAAAPSSTDLLIKWLPASVFGIFFLSFILYLLYIKRAYLTPASFIFSLPFVIVGIITVLMAPLAAALQPYWESYAITDRRAIITRIPPFDSFSLGPNEMDVPTTIRHADGRGDILFHTTYSHDKSGNPVVTREGFISVFDPLDVARLIMQVRAGQAGVSPLIASRPSGISSANPCGAS